jgi:hypothetical protein
MVIKSDTSLNARCSRIENGKDLVRDIDLSTISFVTPSEILRRKWEASLALRVTDSAFEKILDF